MFKPLVLLIALAILPLLSFSQISFSEGPPYKTYTGNYLLYFQSGDEMLGFKRDGDVFILQKYNLKTLTQSSIMTYKDMPDEYNIEYVKEFNKKYYFFYSMADRGKKTATLYCREINFATGTFVSKGNVLITVNSELKGSFFIFNSLNDERLMVQYTLLKTHLNDDINHQTIGFYVYDRNLQFLWNAEVEMPYPEKYAQYLTEAVDSEGNVYYIIRTYDKDTPLANTFEDENKKYRIELLKIEKGKMINKTALKLSSNAVRDIIITEVSPNEMMCVGFYNLKSASVPTLFTCTINSDGSSKDISYDITADIVNQYEDKKIKNNKDIPDLYELGCFSYSTLQKDKNGDLLIISECVNSSYMDGYYINHYDDLLVTKIDAQNNLKWMYRLPKRPFKAGSSMSYKLFSREENDYIVFLDHEENKNLKINDIHAKRLKSNETVLSAYKINKTNGRVEKIILLDTKETNGKQVYRLTSERIMEASITELVVEAYKKDNEDILIKIKGIE